MIIQIAITIVGLYFSCGLLFAVPFVIKGVNVIDESARETKLGFRLIIVPGTVIFWPLLLSKWINSKKND